ncbi:MAG: hypothetical protein MJE77_12640 [Proteobacteria bacterium]|nr:hypothetical protein [Pseudomonadota bacterium]
MITIVPDVEIKFHVAGLEVLLRSQQPDGLAGLTGFYRHYPGSGRQPGLIVDIERIGGFAHSRAADNSIEPDYPAFHRTALGPDRIGLSRLDAEGEFTLPGAGATGPVCGRFCVNESANSVEAVVRIGTSIAMPRLGGLVLHASAITAISPRLPGPGGDEKPARQAFVFAGVSGAGKSTIAAMIAESSPRFGKVSDELVIVRPDRQGRWKAHVTPFIGGDGLPHGACYPIAAVHFLEQANDHRRISISRSAALRELLRHVLVYVCETDTASHVLQTASELVGAVDCHRLQFAKNPGVLEVLGIT